MKHVLIVNDDGIHSQGIHALSKYFLDKGWRVSVVAPAENQSGKAFSITISEPVKITANNDNHTEDFKRWAVHGTPVDCVKLALYELLPEYPNLVVSGINAGANTGFNIQYSGTVAAALEAQAHGIPAIALSIDEYTPNEEHYAQSIQLLDWLLLHWDLDAQYVLNINIPSRQIGSPADTARITSRLMHKPNGQYHETSQSVHQLCEVKGTFSAEHPEDTDVGALSRGLVSITPIKLNFDTDHGHEKLKAIFNK
ncbi:MAG: 5'/3'-nucleotidase SurE [Candidatus Margulisbacteria bacterium]|nr:5'/3'-nucleotidase SurE [Candidatus Margulisiibacteriota bacterium]